MRLQSISLDTVRWSNIGNHELFVNDSNCRRPRKKFLPHVNGLYFHTRLFFRSQSFHVRLLQIYLHEWRIDSILWLCSSLPLFRKKSAARERVHPWVLSATFSSLRIFRCMTYNNHKLRWIELCLEIKLYNWNSHLSLNMLSGILLMIISDCSEHACWYLRGISSCHVFCVEFVSESDLET